MPQTVEMPDGVTLEFPDGMPQEAMRQAILTKYLPQAESAGYETVTAEDIADRNYPETLEATPQPHGTWYRPAWFDKAKQAVRESKVGVGIFGLTEQQKEGRLPSLRESSPGLQQLGEKMLEMTSLPPQLREPVKAFTSQAVKLAPQYHVAKWILGDNLPEGYVKGLQEAATTLPIAPIGGKGKAASVIMGEFTREFVDSLPETKKAYADAIARGDTKSAAQIATQTGIGGAMLIGGWKHAKTEWAKLSDTPATEAAAKEAGVPVIEGVKPITDVQGKEVPLAKPIFQAVKEAVAAEKPAPSSPKEVSSPPREQPPKSEPIPVEEVKPKSLTEAEQADALKELAALQEEEPNAIQERSTEALPVGETPSDSGTVVERVPESAQLAKDGPPLETGESAQVVAGGAQSEVRGEVKPLSPADKGISKEEKVFRSTAEGQKTMAARASRIAVLNQLNEAIRKVNPNEAYPRELIDSLPDSQIDGMLETLRQDYNKTITQPQEAPNVEVQKTEEAVTPAKKVKKPTQREVNLAGQYYQDAIKLYGENNMETQRRFQKYHELKNLRERKSPGPGAASPEDVLGGTELQSGLGRIPGLSRLDPLVEKTIDRGKDIITAVRYGLKRKPVKETASALRDAADNKAVITGEQAKNSVRLEGDSDVSQRAATFAMQAKGDINNLDAFLQKVQGRNVEAGEAIIYARNHWQEVQRIVDKAKAILDAQIHQENANGIDTQYKDWYVPQRWEGDFLSGPNEPVIMWTRGKGRGSSWFKKPTVIPDYATGIELGGKPKNLRLDALVGNRVRSGQMLMNKKSWVDGYRTITDPIDGKPIIAELVRKETFKDGEKIYREVTPSSDYVPFEVMPGVRVALHRSYSHLFDALTGKGLADMPGFQAALQLEGGLKHSLLLLDTFHASRMAQYATSIMGKPSYMAGATLLEYKPGDLARAVAKGEITQEMADWVTESHTMKVGGQDVTLPRNVWAKTLVDQGLNVGRIHDALYRDIVRQIPGIGHFNKWIFDKLTRGAMMQAGLVELQRTLRLDPSLTIDQAASKVAKDINIFFGNLGRQGFFKDPRMRDFLQLTLLAPQWVESLVQKEVRFAKRTGMSGVGLLTGKGTQFGTIGRGMGAGLAAYFVATQALNYLFRGHSTFENEEEGHKIDAFIPDPTGQTPGFWLSPMSVFAEVTHDVIRYSEKKDQTAEVITQIAENKLSPLSRAMLVLGTGKDPIGQKLPSTWARAKAAGLTLAPTPIGVSAAGKESLAAAGLANPPPPGTAIRQAAGSLGFKIEPGATAAQRIGKMAREFVEENGKPKESETVYLADRPYNNLRSVLRRDNEKAILEAIQELRETRKDAEIRESFYRSSRYPFTGSVSMESKFKRTLTPEERELYRAAILEKRDTYRKFLKFWNKRGPRPQ